MTIFLAVPAALLLLLLLPARVWVRVDPEPSVTIGYLWAKKTVLPAPEKKPRPPAVKKRKPKPRPEAKGKAGLDLGEGAGLLLELIPRVARPVRRLLRRTTVARLELELTVSKPDAAATAIAYGQAQAVTVNAVALLDRVVRLKIRRIDIIPDFSGEGARFFLAFEVRLLPLAALAAALNIGTAALWTALRLILPRAGPSKPEQPLEKERETSNGKQASHQ